MQFSERQISPGHSGYPRRLAGVDDAPEWLYIRGAIPERERVVTIVGARGASARDVRLAHDIAAALAARGVLVISGGAVGVDAAAHRGAMASGQPTVAVLGCGLDVVYPAGHRDLYRAIAASGAVASQYEPGAQPLPWRFVRRNHTMAGMADAVLVIAATARSGSLHTARRARQLGRIVAAVPGTPGCHALIASGAAAVRDADDMERALAGRIAAPDVTLPDRASHAGQVLACLDGSRPRDTDDISLATGLGVREVDRALTTLELDGLAILLPGRNYVCSTLAQTLLVR